MGVGASTRRWTTITTVGVLGLAVAGIVMIVGTFLPWVSEPAVMIEETGQQPVPSDTAVRTYTGWQLQGRCGQSDGFALCSVEDKSFEGRTSVLTGAWSLFFGSIFVVLALVLALSLLRGRKPMPGWLFAICLLASLLAVATGAYEILKAADQLPPAIEVPPNGTPTPGPSPVHGGLVLVVCAAALALVGTTVAFLGSRKAFD